jgi:ATP adenylyltransferase
MSYVTGSSDTSEAQDRSRIFLDALEDADNPDSLVVWRGEHAFVVMNLFPYNTGHMMVVPNRRVSSLEELRAAERSEVMELVSHSTEVATGVLRCDGFNIGLNIGAVGGAGIAEHLHVHVVPRWLGDANFMPITANTMVLPELLPATTARLKGEFLAREIAHRDPTIRSTAGALTYLQRHDLFVVRQTSDGASVIPKGHIEAGETASEAAIREVAEETGYRATISDWGGVETFELRGDRFHTIYFLAVGVETDDVKNHLDHDTVLVKPSELVDRLSFSVMKAVGERARVVLRR